MKKIIYSLIASVVVLCFASCDPQDNDSHSLGGQLVDESDISFSVTTTENPNEYAFTNTSKQLSADVQFFWSLDGKKMLPTTPGDVVKMVYRKAGSYSVSLYAFTQAGQTEISQTFTVAQDLKEEGDEFAWTGFGFDNNGNLFKNATFTNEFYYANADWQSYGDPTYNLDGNQKLEMTYDQATVAQWQNQVHFITNIAVSSGKTYDFSVAIKATNDIPAATVKVGKDGDDDTMLFLADKNVSLKANEVKVVYGTALAGFDGNAKITFDFGGSPENTDVTIYDIVLAEHNDANVAPLDYNSDANLWKAVDETKALDVTFWWANADWGQIGDPEFEQDGNVYTITANDATAAEWQAQNVFAAKSLGLGAGDVVDFSCIMKASNDSRITIKLCDQADDDNQSFYKNDIQLKAGNVQVIKFTGTQLAKGDAAKVKLILDFGGCQAGTEFKIGDITLIKQ